MTANAGKVGTSRPAHADGPYASGDPAQRAEALRARILELDLELNDLEDPGQQEATGAASALGAATSSQPHSRSAAPVLDTPAVDATTESQVSWFLPWRKSRRGWLVSAALHTLLLVALALAATDITTSSRSTTVLLPSDPTEQIESTRPTIIPPAKEVGQPYLQQMNSLPPRQAVATAEDVMSVPSLDAAAGDFALDGTFTDPGSMLMKMNTRQTKPAGGQGAQFFGVQAAGNRFVFVVDSSMSMVDKVRDLRQELEAAIRRLTQDQQFYVVFFDHDAERMRFGKWNKDETAYAFNAAPEQKLAYATPENVDACIRWMNAVRLEFSTNPYEAVAYAVNELQPEAIFLLSDGEFTDGGLTEAFLFRTNREPDADGQSKPKINIHCIAFYSRSGEVVLKRIAAANGGTYRFVDSPPGYVPRVRTPGYTAPRRR